MEISIRYNNGNLTFAIAEQVPNGRVVAIDLSESMIEKCKAESKKSKIAFPLKSLLKSSKIVFKYSSLLSFGKTSAYSSNPTD